MLLDFWIKNLIEKMLIKIVFVYLVVLIANYLIIMIKKIMIKMIIRIKKVRKHNNKSAVKNVKI